MAQRTDRPKPCNYCPHPGADCCVRVQGDQHDKPADVLVAADLGAALTMAADGIEEHVEAEAERHIAFAVRLEHHCPSDAAIAQLTNDLLTHCSSLADGIALIPEAERPARGTAAVRMWVDLVQAGPGDGPLGNWSYARQLGIAGRALLQELREHRRMSRRRAAFVGRTELPPVPVESP
ncbi:DUF6415 family natural product biosynthesis protein [Streptomyces sp. NPDC048659]|uniref:DUF6415 family natural product biosynthesis protein n=1 Tax=Streptomyces sp. NPDC048659 TaxID=3155489 RepID=UPI00341816BE